MSETYILWNEKLNVKWLMFTQIRKKVQTIEKSDRKDI